MRRSNGEKLWAVAIQTESQIISSPLIRDDRENQERSREQKKAYLENKNDKKMKKRQEKERLHIVILVNTIV